MNEENVIPQLDGGHSVQMIICEKCETTFETDDQLQKHMQNEWGVMNVNSIVHQNILQTSMS